MPRNVIGEPPFPVKVLDTDNPVTWAEVNTLLGEAEGVSLCIRSQNGPAKRGGYFFHFQRVGTHFQIMDFERKPIDLLDADALVRLINHASGRQFDSEMLTYCQTVVNLRQDQTVAETDV